MIDKAILNNEKGKNVPFMAVLTGVWLILLSLCALIGLLIVPVSTSNQSDLMVFVISTAKVSISLIFVLVWLVGWYKMMNYLLGFQFYLADLNSNPKDN